MARLGAGISGGALRYEMLCLGNRVFVFCGDCDELEVELYNSGNAWATVSVLFNSDCLLSRLF